jgi:hypothetical protein
MGGMIEAQGSSNDLCIEGHTGPMCMLCDVANVSQHMSYFDSRCRECPTDRDRWLQACGIIGGMVGVVVLIGAFRCCLHHDVLSRQCQMDNVKTTFHRVVVYLIKFIRIFRRTAVPRCKILFTFYQVVVQMPRVYAVDMPTEYCE